MTCSAPKSVSVLWALADDAARRPGRWRRMTRRSRRWRDGSRTTPIPGSASAARSRSWTPKASSQRRSASTPAGHCDPQLHTHLVIANRVRSPDGRWLALDARRLKVDQDLSALYHAGSASRAHRRLGVRWEPPEHGIAGDRRCRRGGAPRSSPAGPAGRARGRSMARCCSAGREGSGRRRSNAGATPRRRRDLLGDDLGRRAREPVTGSR